MLQCAAAPLSALGRACTERTERQVELELRCAPLNILLPQRVWQG